jgi:N-methylhydantoinase A/oxoprolinase/acetone carboxylase beta subunit
VALIKDGVPLIRQESVIGGYPVRVSQVDVNSIGSGGGSIAWLDGAGGLKVGPQSAGSEPGPACYGTGGTEAAVTDASIVLGYLDPNYFAGGTLKLQPERSFAAVQEKIAAPLGLTVARAALGIHQVINSQMAEAIRFVSIRQGYDPREFALVALGGAGALHATQLATELSITRIIIPRYPGVLSASGLLVAPTEHEASAAFPRSLASLTSADAQSVFDELDSRCAQFMAAEGAAAESIQRFRYADMCYQGQSYNIEIPFPDARDPIAQLTRDFLRAHERVYGYAADSPIAIVNLRAIHRSLAQTKFAEQDYAPSGGPPLKGRRCVMFQAASGPVETPVYQRDELELGAEIRGPAIFEQSDTTMIVEPGWSARVEKSGNIIITRNREKNGNVKDH